MSTLPKTTHLKDWDRPTTTEPDDMDTQTLKAHAYQRFMENASHWPLVREVSAFGRIARNFRMLANKFRGAWRPALRRWLLTMTWPVQLKYGELLCILNRHQDEEAPAVDKNGDFLPELPGRYSQCRRPKCQRIRGRVTLLETDRVCEVPDMTVIAWKNCKQCGGRGYAAKMQLGPGNQGKQTKAKQPCECLQIQPCFLEHIEAKK